MIVPTPDRPSRARGSRSERDLAIGLVLLALLAALLTHYALVLTCQPDSPWPCRTGDVLRAQASATITATAAAVQPAGGLPLAFPTPRPNATASVPVQPAVVASATGPAFAMPSAPPFATATEGPGAVVNPAPSTPDLPIMPTGRTAAAPPDQSLPTATMGFPAPATGYP